VLAAMIVLAGAYWGVTKFIGPADEEPARRLAAASRLDRPPLVTDRRETGPLDGGDYAHVPERGADSIDPTAPSPKGTDTAQAAALLKSAMQAMAQGDAVLARAHFSEAMKLGLSEADELEARTRLRKLGQDTVYSPRCYENDPFAAMYVIQPGDTLLKIAHAHNVTPELLARINNIANVHRISAGQRIKVVKGPFHARVNKSEHTMDVFLGDTFVEHFKVGLGAEDSTPPGKWVVKNKLENPTYYPPRGGDIVAADDPENPLGERWIGLEGVEGGALGQTRYGIHGTIEPESIGRNASMGCIRLFNLDVEMLFDLLIVGKSYVEVVD